MNLAPVVIFVYNRPDLTLKTLEALKKNFLSKNSDLFIFSDGPKDKDNGILEVRDIINKMSGFRSVNIYESKTNKGLANSVIDGVTEILKKYDKIIVLEDDLITSPNFLDFMNQALNFYEKEDSIFSISGYSMHLPSLQNEVKDYYLGYRASSWGWGTWSKSWIDIDWEIKDYSTFSKSLKLKRKFNKGGSDMSGMLKNQMNNKIDSWAIRWCFNQFVRNQLTIYPVLSKVESIGFGESATHTKKTTRFNTVIDEELKRNFHFDNELKINEAVVKDFKSKFSLFARLKDKLL